MATVWPLELPQYVLEEGFNEALSTNTVESQTDSGAPRIRRRFTARWEPLSVTIMCSAAQSIAFEAFYYTTTKSGQVPFQWVHPRTQAPCEMRFKGPAPKATPAAENTRWSFEMWCRR